MKIVSVDDEYRKNKQVRPEDVQVLLDWISKQPHLPEVTELECIFFLNAYGGSIELAKGLTDTYYTSRTHCPEFFSNRNPKNLLKNMNVLLYYPFDQSNSDSTKALYSTFLDTNPSNLNLNEVIKLLWMVYDVWLLQRGAFDSLNFILDMKGIQLGHMTKFSPSAMKKALFILQEAVPFKISKIHIVNVIPLADKILSILKPFIKVELLDKIIFHSEGLATLKNYIPEKDLPKNLSGQGPTLEEMHEKMKNMLLNNTEYFEAEISKRVDESKRPGKPKNSSDLFGIEGSFKKLDID